MDATVSSCPVRQCTCTWAGHKDILTVAATHPWIRDKKQAKTRVRCRRELPHSKGFERLADLGAHVPHSAHAVSAAGHEDVEAGMQRQRVHPAEVAMVLPDHLHNSHQAWSGHELPARMYAAGEVARACEPPCMQVRGGRSSFNGRAHLVVLQVPALDLLVQAAGEHVGVPGRQRQPCHLHTQPEPEHQTAHTQKACA